jgi:hypothetical protein
MNSDSPRRDAQPSPPRAGERAADGHIGLFLVERRLPGITERTLEILQVALAEASRRFAARGEPVLYMRSTFMPRQQRLLSLFASGSLELVRAVNEAALAPFICIEPVFDLPYPSDSAPE